MWVELLVAVVIVVITATAVNWYLRSSEDKRNTWLTSNLGVPDIYVWDEKLIKEKEDAYFDALEDAERIYCEKNNVGPDQDLDPKWPSQLDPVIKNKVKMKLMDRTMAWVHTYRLMEAELKKSQPLWRQNIISPKYWTSLKDAEEKLEKQFTLIKKEVAMIDPTNPNQTEIFRESCRVIDQYGYPPKMPQEQPKPAEPPGVNNGRIIERVIDNKTFECLQGPNDSELVVYVPADTTAKDLRVRGQRNMVQIWRKGEIHWERKLHELASCRPDPNWQLVRKTDFEVGDEVILGGLSKAELNGQKGKVLKGTKDTIAKGRVRIDLGAGINPLSIKKENLTNTEEWRKCAVVMTLEKEKKATIWPMPPWAEKIPDEKCELFYKAMPASSNNK
ncbi:unnamed protein product [Amoebophrya sp. A25]|nr:unnamed protein product [Amoebophrya sp. A25]|eukprot:GSA25T00004539001.1